MNKQRINRKTLGNVCMDCCDFLKTPCVECEDCPVARLRLRLKKIKDKNNPNTRRR